MNLKNELNNINSYIGPNLDSAKILYQQAYLKKSKFKNISFKINYLKKKQTTYPIRNIPFRFLNNSAYKSLLKQNNIRTDYLEEIQKTYFQGREKFTFIVIEGTKIK